MKNSIIIIFLLLALSCGSTKKVAKASTETITPTEAKSPNQQPKGGEFKPPKEDDSKTNEHIDIVTVEITPQTDNDNVPEKPKEEEELTLQKEDSFKDIEAQTTTLSKNKTFFKTDKIHKSLTILLQEHVSKGGQVNYQGFKKDASLIRGYIASLGEHMPEAAWTKNEKLAYWINAYNAMTIDLIIRNYPISSIKDIDKPWDQRLWKLGSKWYNLNEIEHQILRKMDEPRIHFGIVCASFSCPKLQNEAFTARNLEQQLTDATKEFLADTKRNNISESSLKLSKIFKWFAKDFKENGSLIDFLNQYTDLTISKNAKKSFKDYNWDLNE